MRIALSLKRFLPRSLLWRALIIGLAPLLLVQAVSTWVFLDRHFETTSRQLAESVAGDIAAMLNLFERFDQNREEIDTIAWLYFGFRILDLPIYQFDHDAPIEPQGLIEFHLAEALKARIPYPFTLDIGYRKREASVKIATPQRLMRITMSRKRLFSPTTYIFLMWNTGSSIILMIVFILFMKNQIRPVRRLAQAAEAFGRGADIIDFKPEGGSEVRQAASAFIEMRERIQRQIRQRTEMLAGISHDLGTPLTRMRLALEMIQANPSEVTGMKSDITEMQSMINEYIAFARGEDSEATKWIDLGELVDHLVVDADRVDKHLTHNKKHQESRISFKKPDSTIMIEGRKQSLSRAFRNVIDNALRYGDQVYIHFACVQTHIDIIVDDNGPGIAETELQAVFRPFYRLEGSRNSETGGVGLGLSIARDIIHSHGGKIVLQPSPMGGLRAYLHLPLARPSPPHINP